MKLRNFALVGAVVAVAAIGGSYWACSGKSNDSTKDAAPKADPAKDPAKAPTPTTPAPPTTPTTPSTTPASPPPPGPPPTGPFTPPPKHTAESGTDDLGKRAYDDEVVNWRTKTIAGDHLKDVTKGKAYKLDLYKDAGSTTPTRAKLDLNRNGKWDEKFTFKGDEITLQRAPADDEKYTESYHWTGTGWVKAK